jgi:hypothetical protein
LKHQIQANQLADLVSSATDIARRSPSGIATILKYKGNYEAKRADFMAGDFVYVVFRDGSYEQWDPAKSRDYLRRAQEINEQLASCDESR